MTLDLKIVEALVIPVYLEDEISGTIWIVGHDEELKFDSQDVRIMKGLAEFTGCALRLAGEVTARKRTEEMLRKTQANLEVGIDARTAQLQQLSARLMTVQDAERRHLARELHDSAGQYLAGIQINLKAVLRETPTLAALQ